MSDLKIPVERVCKNCVRMIEIENLWELECPDCYNHSQYESTSAIELKYVADEIQTAVKERAAAQARIDLLKGGYNHLMSIMREEKQCQTNKM